MNAFSAGQDQVQDVFDAFQTLVNGGFLHDQGILTLEAVQKFYEQILEKPKNATLIEEKLVDFCKSKKKEVQPVVTLMLKNLTENQDYYHAVLLQSSVLGENLLTVTFVDSRPRMGEITMHLPLSEASEFKSGEKFVIFDTKVEEDWCLGDQMCHFLVFN